LHYFKTLADLITGVRWADITFSWFASPATFFTLIASKFFHKPAVVVVGGYEVAKVPEIGYGAMLNPVSARITASILKNADAIIAISEFSRNEISNYSSTDNVELIFNGYDEKLFRPGGKKDDVVITIAYANSWKTVRLKGLDTFVLSARYLPDLKFAVIGVFGEAKRLLQAIAPPNVVIVGPVTKEKIVAFCQNAKIYCQLSYRESFGVALVEAMACGCIPVVTDNSSHPEIVGNTGLYVPYDNPEATANTIAAALLKHDGTLAQKRAAAVFPLKNREEKISKLIKNLYIKK